MIRATLLTTAVVMGLAIGPLNAADISRPIYKAPVAVMPVAYNWSGNYLGGYAGAAFGEDVSATDLDNWNAFGQRWSYGVDPSFIGGGTIGINWQAPGSAWVFGVEGEFGYISLKGNARDPISPGLDTWSHTKIGSWYGFAGGRMGYAWDRTLVYAKGGAAFVNMELGVTDSSACCGGGGLINALVDDTKTTWALGGGIEWAWIDSWSVKVEYLYVDLKDSLNACGRANGGASFCWQHDVDAIQTVKAGLNYRFGLAKAPVVARY